MRIIICYQLHKKKQKQCKKVNEKYENPSIGYTKLEIIMNCREESNLKNRVIMRGIIVTEEKIMLRVYSGKNGSKLKNCKSN